MASHSQLVTHRLQNSKNFSLTVIFLTAAMNLSPLERRSGGARIQFPAFLIREASQLCRCLDQILIYSPSSLLLSRVIDERT